MLKNADINDRKELEKFLSSGIISLRILSYITAYGFVRDFLRLWYSYDENGINAVISLFENSVLVKTNEKADFSELSAFLSMLSYDTISCDAETADFLCFDDYAIKQGYVFSGEPSDFTSKSIDETHLKDVYNLISERIPDSFSDSKDAYFSFLSDFTFRARRDLARGKCIYENNILAACAVTSAETENKALLSGVAASKDFKGSGYGKNVVLSLVSELQKNGKSAYVIALNDSAQGFYEHIGFEKDSLIAYINRKD